MKRKIIMISIWLCLLSTQGCNGDNFHAENAEDSSPSIRQTSDSSPSKTEKHDLNNALILTGNNAILNNKRLHNQHKNTLEFAKLLTDKRLVTLDQIEGAKEVEKLMKTSTDFICGTVIDASITKDIMEGIPFPLSKLKLSVRIAHLATIGEIAEIFFWGSRDTNEYTSTTPYIRRDENVCMFTGVDNIDMKRNWLAGPTAFLTQDINGEVGIGSLKSTPEQIIKVMKEMKQ